MAQQSRSFNPILPSEEFFCPGSRVYGEPGPEGPAGPEGERGPQGVGVAVQATAPATPALGDAWFNTDNRNLSIFTGFGWDSINRPRMFFRGINDMTPGMVHGDMIFDGLFGDGSPGLLDIYYAPYDEWRKFGGGISGHIWGNQFHYARVWDNNASRWRQVSLGAVSWNSQPYFVQEDGSLWFHYETNMLRAFYNNGWHPITAGAVRSIENDRNIRFSAYGDALSYWWGTSNQGMLATQDWINSQYGSLIRRFDPTSPPGGGTQLRGYLGGWGGNGFTINAYHADLLGEIIAHSPLTLQSVPTSDPGIPGRVWRDGNHLMISI